MSRNNRIFIVGAGFAGIELAKDLKRKDTIGEISGFLDDDPQKKSLILENIPVLGSISEAKTLTEGTTPKEAYIAIPTADRETIRRIYNTLKECSFQKIRILPLLSQIMDGDVHFIQTRNIDAEDLLGRTPAAIPLKETLEYLRNKRVLITGAGGSIGGELARQLLSGGAERLYLFDHSEQNVYEIEKELRILQEEGVGETASIVPVIGDLRDSDFVHFILARLKADVVFHCAAYKHVPLLEANPVEAVKNNVFGTQNIVNGAIEAGISRFVLISTDKAVDPFCIYGASKMIAEEIVLNAQPETGDFMVVRFGNVLGSQGSIVPLFKKQIEKGGPVTITHPETSRFFMTIPEACSLVLQTGGVGTGGDLYILDMGNPLKIKDMAEQMIQFYGYQPGNDIRMTYIGLRPGEKLHETLWADDELPKQTKYPKINKLIRNTRFNGSLQSLLDQLKPICSLDPAYTEIYRNRIELRKRIRNFIPSVEDKKNESPY